jgi:hypothetical protein
VHCPRLILAVSLLAIGGCSTSFALKNPLPKQASEEARLAAHEASDEYPAGTAAKACNLVALVDRDAKAVRLVNPTDHTYAGLRIWLDGKFVAWLNELPAQRVVVLANNSFFNADGTPYSSGEGKITRVEAQIDGELYRFLGPALEPSEEDRPKGRGVEFSFPPKRTG